MRCSTWTGVLVTSAGSLLSLTTARTISIKSLADAPFFDPTNTTADIGDVLEFHFMAHNRSVVMGDLDTPCEPAAEGGFYSGFFVDEPNTTHESTDTVIATANQATVFRVTVNDTQPLVYYCSQNGAGFGNHCKDSGMAGVVNQPDLTRLQSYRDAAALVNTSVTPSSPPFGGVFAANPDTDAVNGSSTSTTSAAVIGARIGKAECAAGAFAWVSLSVFATL